MTGAEPALATYRFAHFGARRISHVQICAFGARRISHVQICALRSTSDFPRTNLRAFWVVWGGTFCSEDISNVNWHSHTMKHDGGRAVLGHVQICALRSTSDSPRTHLHVWNTADFPRTIFLASEHIGFLTYKLARILGCLGEANSVLETFSM